MCVEMEKDLENYQNLRGFVYFLSFFRAFFRDQTPRPFRPMASGLLLLLHGACGTPDRMPCSQRLTVGDYIMSATSVSDSQYTASFVGKTCGGTFTAGETLMATANAPPDVMMELTGGATFTGGICNGVRINWSNSATVSTTGSGATITLKHGFASSKYASVRISSCTLTRLAASSLPPPPPFTITAVAAAAPSADAASAGAAAAAAVAFPSECPARRTAASATTAASAVAVATATVAIAAAAVADAIAPATVAIAAAAVASNARCPILASRAGNLHDLGHL